MLRISDSYPLYLYTYSEIQNMINADDSYMYKDIIPCIKQEISNDGISARSKIYNNDFTIGYCLNQKTYFEKVKKRAYESLLGYTVEGDTETMYDEFMFIKGHDLSEFVESLEKRIRYQLEYMCELYVPQNIAPNDILIVDVNDRIAYNIVLDNIAKVVGRNLTDHDTEFKVNINEFVETYKANEFFILFLFKEDLESMIRYLQFEGINSQQGLV